MLRNVLLFSTLIPIFCTAQEIKVVHDFESEAELKQWDIKNKSGSIVSEHATHGQKCLKISSNEYMFWYRVPKDWSAFDTLDIDVFVDGEDPVSGSLLIADEAWQKTKGGTYWNRHNGTFNLKPGANTVSIPVNGLYRGESGSRNADIKSNIDPKSIIRFDIGFSTKGKPASLYLDYMRFVKESRPDGILAFDFGPPSQAVFPGFTPITWNTVYGKEGVKAGLWHSRWSVNTARDDGFPTRLYQDFVNMGDEEFIAEVPNGKYHVWVVFDDLGYWGGEQAHVRRRWIESNGKELWSEDRGEDGPADYLYRFEKVEPKPGDSMWDLYVKQLFEPKRFEAEATEGKLRLRFKETGNNSCKVAGLIIYPESIKADAEKWVAEVEERNRKEFESRAAFMGPKPDDVPQNAAKDSLTVGYPDLEDNIYPRGNPGPSTKKLTRTVARGQRASFTFAVRAFKDYPGEIAVTSSDFTAAQGTIPASNVDMRYVHYLTHRGYNDIAYTIGPESLRPVKGSSLTMSQYTRQFWITVSAPVDAKAGTYSGVIKLDAGTLHLDVPLSLEVLDFTLDEPAYLMGFYGASVPGEISKEKRSAAWRELFRVLKDYGMNSISGGPNIPFSGLDEAGKPKLDFSACDEYFKIAREAGFTTEFNAYGGPGMVEGLHDSHTIGETGHNWEKKTGKSFKDLLKIVWGAVKEHAEKENWPPIAYELVDEPRVIETAREIVELLRAYQEAVPFVRIGGSYSVKWNNDPLEMEIQNIFKTLVWSALNEHKQVDIDKSKELGRELYIYNQGTTRYSFGAYQWAEFHKGVRGRMQWHLLALHGYQFFDLDGREPDTAMINWGRNEVIPTIHLARCREGADDFRFAVTLWNLAQKKKDLPAAQAAIKWLEEVSSKIAVGQNERPKDFMDDETFRNTCIDHIKKISAK